MAVGDRCDLANFSSGRNSKPLWLAFTTITDLSRIINYIFRVLIDALEELLKSICCHHVDQHTGLGFYRIADFVLRIP